MKGSSFDLVIVEDFFNEIKHSLFLNRISQPQKDPFIKQINDKNFFKKLDLTKAIFCSLLLRNERRGSNHDKNDRSF